MGSVRSVLHPVLWPVLYGPWAGEGSGDAPIVWTGPITISAGGTYTGNWRSTDPAIAAVTIATSQPVTLRDFRAEGPGHQIRATSFGSYITLQNGVIVGKNPNINGQCTGRAFADFAGIIEFQVLNCTIAGSAGLYLDGGGSVGFMQLLRIRGNKFINVDGRNSNGSGGYLTTASLVQALQINGYRGIVVGDVDWNYVENNPGRSRVEDAFNYYRAGGVSGRPLRTWNNYIRGAYPSQPVTDAFSGGGIIVDGDATGPSDASRYHSIDSNVVVGTVNHGIGLAAGMDGSVTNNRVIGSGRLPTDGPLMAAANIGIYIWDVYGDTAQGAYSNNSGANNYVGWINASGNRADTYTPDASSFTGTTGPGAITTATELAEFAAWNSARITAGIQLGSSLRVDNYDFNDDPGGSLTISGTAQVGQTLTAVTSALTDPDGLGSFAYQWFKAGTAIGGATSSTYVPVSGDIGSTLTVRVIYTDTLGTITSIVSAATSAVIPAVGPSGFTVLSSGGSSYSVSLTALASNDTPYTVPAAVLDSAGSSYTPI